MPLKECSQSLMDFGPHLYGSALIIDPSESQLKELLNHELPFVCDVEDDEQGNFVGIGIMADPGKCFYFSVLSDQLRTLLDRRKLVFHNGKSDLHKLRLWSIPVTSDQLWADTMLMSYVQHSTRESHGLKELAKELLGISYPSYKEIVGKGKAKLTLDKQPVELVARYNGMDLVCTYKLAEYFTKTLTHDQWEYYKNLELPVARLLFEMEEKGVMVDANYLRKLDDYFGVEISRISAKLRGFARHHSPVVLEDGNGSGSDLNLNSPKQVQELLLKANGINVASTNKEALRAYEGVPLVQLFRRYRELSKLRSTYTSALLSFESLPRVHTTYNQCSYDGSKDTWGGIRTGRLSSSSPNLQNIPTRTETGNSLRRAFVAKSGHLLVDADYSQIEWRIAAHFSQDKAMISALRSDVDPYQMVADRAKKPRDMAKTAMLAMNYGAGGYKVAQVLRISDNEGFEFVRAYKETFPEYFAWKDAVTNACKRDGFITTLWGRQIRPESIILAVPYMVQGSAGEVIKVAAKTCADVGFMPVLTVHDELVFEFPQDYKASDGMDLEGAVLTIKQIMENVVKLTVPLVVEIGMGANWDEAKG